MAVKSCYKEVSPEKVTGISRVTAQRSEMNRALRAGYPGFLWFRTGF